MKINEIILKASQQPAAVQPSVVNQQARVAKVMNDIAVSANNKAPTEEEKVLAIRNIADQKQRNNREYAARLAKQLVIAKNATR